MIDKKKIRIMTAMAVYDKYYGYNDRKIQGYFRADYIYKKNSFTRLYVLVGCIVVLGCYGINMVFNGNFDITELNYVHKAQIFAIALIVILVLYTIVGTYIHGKEYDNASKRLENYERLMYMLEKIEPDNTKESER